MELDYQKTGTIRMNGYGIKGNLQPEPKPDFVGGMVTAGCSKPNPGACYWVLEQTGLKVDDVLYCACPQRDLQGTIAIGMRTIWLNRDNEPLTGAQPEFIVSDLCGVTKVIESFINK